MKTCNECHVIIQFGEYCKLCAPYMKGPKVEVSMTQFIVEGKMFELAKFSTRSLLKLLRTEGYLPKESAGKTTVDQVSDLLIHVSYKHIDLKVDLDLDRSFTKGLNVFEAAEVEALIAKEQSDYSDMSGQWDMIEDHIRTHGTDVESDAEGHEIGAELVLNKPAQNVYVPTEESEFNSDCDAGSWVSPAALMVHASELDSVMEPDFNDLYIELVNYNSNVFTRANTITEEQAFDNLFNALNKLSAIETAKDLSALAKEIYAAQTATKYSQMYYFPKLGSKAFWDAYKAKKAELGIVTIKTEVSMKNFYDQLNACKNSKDLAEVRNAVYNAPYSSEKDAFWAAYRTKAADIYKALEVKRAQVFVEICNLINQYESATMLYKVNSEIYKAYLPLEVKKVLWAKVTTKIQTGSVEINIQKGLAYMESLFKKAA